MHRTTVESSQTVNEPIFKSFGILDQFLAAWVSLDIASGIIMSNFVCNTGTALQNKPLLVFPATSIFCSCSCQCKMR
ncbi:arsenite resistance protein, conidia-enriched transcript [Histoplasma ohiense]|nr:arsenite resistance protein, conidia-enriched transcript [Histoplasma ohiense (nom. inval.)]